MRRAGFVGRGLVASSSISGGVARVRESVDGFVHFGCPLHFVPLGEQDALAEGGCAARVPDPHRARLRRRSP
jgi:hypothetical protein